MVTPYFMLICSAFADQSLFKFSSIFFLFRRHIFAQNPVSPTANTYLCTHTQPAPQGLKIWVSFSPISLNKTDRIGTCLLVFDKASSLDELGYFVRGVASKQKPVSRLYLVGESHECQGVTTQGCRKHQSTAMTHNLADSELARSLISGSTAFIRKRISSAKTARMIQVVA